MRAALALALLNLREILIAIDQLLNVLLCTVGFRRGWSDETLSAHAWRAAKEGRPWGRVFLPVIDWLFSWQKPDPAFKEHDGTVITSHCHRAFLKERERDYLPPIYRDIQ